VQFAKVSYTFMCCKQASKLTYQKLPTGRPTAWQSRSHIRARFEGVSKHYLSAGGPMHTNCSAQALQAEVRRRQSAVLSPLADTAEAAMTARARQQRLSVARTVLAERLAALAAEADANLSGGFL